MTIPPQILQKLTAYLAMAAGILTAKVPALHLPWVQSALVTLFGILLHPQTSITTPAATPDPTKPPVIDPTTLPGK